MQNDYHIIDIMVIW